MYICLQCKKYQCTAPGRCRALYLASRFTVEDDSTHRAGHCRHEPHCGHRAAPQALQEADVSHALLFLKRMSPVEFRNLLQRLGPTFIKIGQFLALRPDLIPQSYCDELMTLLDLAPPFPWSEARVI